MRIVRAIHEIEYARSQWSGPVGLVPTMGYLHEGHLSLFQTARTENATVVASIFVNPTQFGPNEDLERYPRNLERDLHMLEAAGVDVVFTPTASEMYPPGFTTYVEPQGSLVEQGEGASRPNHFRGVATVVLKLFQLIQPQRAYFGQKDAQQVAVITRMVRDLNLPVTLRIRPTVREADGLAMSSRNSYLDPATRAAAPILYQALQAGRQAFEAQPTSNPAAVMQAMAEIVAQEPQARLDYTEVRDAETFLPLERLQAPALLLLAVRLGSVRLIDNFALHTDGTWDTGILSSQHT
ncbi:pantothenate synthetase [Ktedonobacter sp. SOSP1-85]|uniref:pantoate--beta-alanine ligase n=1 Tax=Ktedonobacter sp. SOSP1-85 TaxID=2778367 RepID=UPI0019161EA9|nr:pantoate--beta-alanine ligase [Ktedonobacter sp. SOSP1-85]GHO81622.1 pantothenate synthetase [Ktedonobacter sp. SOSP1-85]